MKAEPVANIGKKGRRRRLVGGVFWIALGIAAAFIIIRWGAGIWWYLLLTVPFTLAALGYFQSRAHT